MHPLRKASRRQRIFLLRPVRDPRIAGNVGPATCGDNTGLERSFGMPTRNIQTTCPYCGRYGWHARTIKHEGAKAAYKCSACKKDHRKD